MLMLQGTSWVHVPADLAYRSISVGGNYRVWATAIDGSVWLRHGADADNPIGMFLFVYYCAREHAVYAP